MNPTDAENRTPITADIAERRLAVLAQCRYTQQAWQQQPGRTLMLFLDGTGNMLGVNEDTNVVKLFRAVDKSAAARQIAYYDPGVGSANEFPAVGPLGRWLRRAVQLIGLALGRGVFDNIAEAYRFLVENYKDGDRICIFGFSRGAFTARAVGGMVNMYGLVHPAGLSILPSMVRSYFSPQDASNRVGRGRVEFAIDVATHFSLGRRPLLHFVGVWDTVESVGLDLFGKGLKISNNPTIAEKRFVHVRHALALHEIRHKYAPRNYTAPDFDAEEMRYRSFDERWFRGNHSDVGGSYEEDGLSNITLAWMMAEAASCGVCFTPGVAPPVQALQPLHDQVRQVPFWAWTGLGSRPREPADQLDPSALPVNLATPALPMRQTAQRMFWLGWTLAVVAALSGSQAAFHSNTACNRGDGTFSLLLAQLLAPFHDLLGVSCDAERVQLALVWDWFFCVAYGLLLAWLVSWGARRAAPAAIAQGLRFGWLARQTPWLMLGLVGADVLENWLSYRLGSGDPLNLCLVAAGSACTWPLLLLAFSSLVKFSCLALLAKVIVKPL